MEFANLLAAHNHIRLTPCRPHDLLQMNGAGPEESTTENSLEASFHRRLDQERAISARELAWVETLRAEVRERAAQAPTQTEAFMRWFIDLQKTGPGQLDRLFPWLEFSADREQLRWFIHQEVAGEAGFEDLVALTQIKIETRPKLEMARNYWDEMGRGVESGMHGPMLGRTAEELDIDQMTSPLVVPAIELGNLMSALAYHRFYAYHSIGALGAIELTAPTRTGPVAKGLKRVGVSSRGTHYFVLHTAVDVRHSEAWNAEILAPLVTAHPEVAIALAEGALMRLEAGARCFRAYRDHYAQTGVHFEG